MTATKIDFAQLHQEAHAAGCAAAQQHITFGGCGFAWVLVKPGNSPFANWLKAQDKASYSNYHKGVMLWVSDYGQNTSQKYAYAAAYAHVLKKHGIKAFAESRLD